MLKSLLAKLLKERLDKYVEVRDYSLREFKLTAEQYRERLRTAVKSVTETCTLFGSRVKNLFLYYLQNRKAKTAEQIIDLLVSDRIKETSSAACLRHVLSTEGTGWFAPEKLTEVIDTYENSQMYLPGKYSKFSGTGSAKPGGCLFRSQNVGSSQNSAAYPRWKTGRSSQANGTPSRWLTAFVTDFGLFEWIRVPFGLKCASNSFIRALQQLFFPLRDFCDSYVDDIATFTSGRLAVALRASACIFAKNAQSWLDSKIGEM